MEEIHISELNAMEDLSQVPQPTLRRRRLSSQLENLIKETFEGLNLNQVIYIYSDTPTRAQSMHVLRLKRAEDQSKRW